MWEHPRGKDTFRLWAGVQSINVHVVVGVGIGWLIYIACTIIYIYMLSFVYVHTVSTFEALVLSSSTSFPSFHLYRP